MSKSVIFIQVTARETIRSINFRGESTESLVLHMLINILRANHRSWHHWDAGHYKKKQFTVHVVVGHSVPPCQHDRSLLHTERLRRLEVGAAAEEWCIPHIIQGKLMSPLCNDDTQCGVTYDMCTNSKHIRWGCCSFRLLYVGHMQHTGGGGTAGEKGRFSWSQ